MTPLGAIGIFFLSFFGNLLTTSSQRCHVTPPTTDTPHTIHITTPPLCHVITMMTPSSHQETEVAAGGQGLETRYVSSPRYGLFQFSLILTYNYIVTLCLWTSQTLWQGQWTHDISTMSPRHHHTTITPRNGSSSRDSRRDTSRAPVWFLFLFLLTLTNFNYIVTLCLQPSPRPWQRQQTHNIPAMSPLHHGSSSRGSRCDTSRAPGMAYFYYLFCIFKK